jgi:hypothetical protein
MSVVKDIEIHVHKKPSRIQHEREETEKGEGGKQKRREGNKNVIK